MPHTLWTIENIKIHENGRKLWATTLMNGANVLHKSATQISDLGLSNQISMCRDAALLRVIIHNCWVSSPSPPTIGGLWKAPESVLTPDAAAVCVGITRSCHLSDIITSHQSDSHLQNLHLQHLVYILHWYMELLVEASPGLKLHWLRLTFPAAVGGLNLFPLLVALVLPPKALDLLLSLLWKQQSPYPKW